MAFPFTPGSGGTDPEGGPRGGVPLGASSSPTGIESNAALPPAESEAEPQRVQGGALPYFFPKPGMANLRSSFWRNHVAKDTRTR